MKYWNINKKFKIKKLQLKILKNYYLKEKI